MKKLLPLFLALILCASAEAAPRAIRVLFLGHEDVVHHNADALVSLLMRQYGREAIYFDNFRSPECLNAETLRHYDAVMLYANHDKITPGQFQALSEFVESGHGFLPIHCASFCFNNEPRFAALVGGHFWKHQTAVFQPKILLPTHPIMDGVAEWSTWDETYVHDQINTQGRTLLMERVEGDHHEPWTWVRTQGKGRVFYTASGHDERTWKDANFLKLLRNAVVWSVGDAVQADWRAFLAQREEEKREPNPNVANYEKRPEAITFQHPFSTKGSMERTQVPADLRLQLFASEPDIAKPIAFAWDERGRLWIAETRDYPHGVVPSGEGHDDIKICEDTDGDGKADKFTVFADKLNLPTSLVFANGGIIVSQPPSFIFLKDTNDDDKADVRETFIAGWGVRDTHAQASNLHWGYDNWIYGAVGYSGFKGEVGGKMLEFRQGTYRFRRDAAQLEFLHQFSNNTWAWSANAAGDQFGGTANGAPIFYGGIPIPAAPEGMRLMSAKKINVQGAAHPITPNFRQVDVMGGYTAAAGSAFLYSASLPPRMQGSALVCEPTMKLLALMDVQPQGAGYVAKDGFNVAASTDEWMSPVFAEVGPDGAIWFADWENFIIQHNPTPTVEKAGYKAETGPGGAHENPLRDHERGRVYRIVWDKAPAQSAAKSLQRATTPQLVAALGDDTQFWRITAQRLLVDGQKTEAAPALKSLVLANDGNVAAIHALWSLDGLGQLDEPTLKAALSAKDPALRRNAIRALPGDARSLPMLMNAGTVADPELHTRLAAFVKLAAFPTTPDLQKLIVTLARDPQTQSDEWLKEAASLLVKKHHAQTYSEGPNLLANAGFETLGADGFPEGWQRRDPKEAPGNSAAKWDVVIGGENVHSGAHALHCVTTQNAETAFAIEVPLKPNTQYRLSGWVKLAGFGKAALRDTKTGVGTETLGRAVQWTEVEVIYDSKQSTQASIAALNVGRGDVYLDDLKLCELLPPETEKLVAGDPKRGEQIFLKHPAAACINCHQLHGAGSAVGPALDGLATRATPAYIEESLLTPSKVLAKGFEQLGVSPMPPMGQLLQPQELADLKAFLGTLK